MDHFKKLFSIIILKPNKVLYNFPKIFQPIVPLKTLGKLIKKVIREQLQFYAISNNFVHLNQLGELKQYYIIDAEIFLTYLIHSEWSRSFKQAH